MTLDPGNPGTPLSPPLLCQHVVPRTPGVLGLLESDLFRIGADHDFDGLGFLPFAPGEALIISGRELRVRVLSIIHLQFVKNIVHILLVLITSLCGNVYHPHLMGVLGGECLRGVTHLPKITDLSGQAGARTEVWLTP